MILHFKYAVLPTEALTFVGYAFLSIEGVNVWPNASIGRITAGDDAFQTEAWLASSTFSGAATILGCPVPNKFGGREPVKIIKCLYKVT